MENMDIVGMLVEKFKEFHASQDFDKQALLEAHKKTYDHIQQVESCKGYISGFTVRQPSEHCRPSVSLAGLRPIRARNLQVGQRHQGRVLFGTLCADALRMLAIMTILEDQFGDAVRLAIYDPSSMSSRTSAQTVRRLYPKGSKVAVKEPYFKQGAQDGVLMLRVDNPQDVEFVTSFPASPETSFVEDLLDLRGKGNACFRDGDWEKSIDYYSRCIQLALCSEKTESQSPGALNIQKQAVEALVYSYSNRSEAMLKLNKYHNAVQDCDKALQIDHHHLKSLCRKGRAFHALGEYKLACQCFERALQLCPTADDIHLQYKKSKELNNQNQQGMFDLSNYFLNGCKPQYVPEVSNYIGPVLVKKSAGRGRGLFATDNVDVGDFLVVDNAIAFSCTQTATTKTVNGVEVDEKFNHVEQDLEAKIIYSAASSQRILQQLHYLADSKKMNVPPMDLFRINNVSWNNYDDCSQSGKLDHQIIVEIMRNVGCCTQNIQTVGEVASRNEQFGLWVLPSFINHSCIPNANFLVVGKAMFVIAARKIAVGEEITVSCFDSLVPLSRREMVCGRMGFTCDCKRCIIERSLVAAEASPVRKIAEFVRSIYLVGLPDFEVSDMALMLDTAVVLENAMNALNDEEKQMIRTSFYQLYYNIFALRLHPCARATLPSMREVFDGFQKVVPGSCTCFEMLARFPALTYDEAEKQSGDPEKELEVCRGFMGKHQENVLRAVLKSVAGDVFRPGFTVIGYHQFHI